MGAKDINHKNSHAYDGEMGLIVQPNQPLQRTEPLNGNTVRPSSNE